MVRDHRGGPAVAVALRVIERRLTQGQSHVRADAHPRLGGQRARAQQMWFTGLRRPSGGWPPGRYRGELHLVRDGQSYLKITREAVVD